MSLYHLPDQKPVLGSYPLDRALAEGFAPPPAAISEGAVAAPFPIEWFDPTPHTRPARAAHSTPTKGPDIFKGIF